MAKLIAADDFLSWAAGKNLGFDPVYPDHLSFLPPHDVSRFWVLNSDPHVWPHLAASILSGLDTWEAGYLWPRTGHWPLATQSTSCHEQVRDVLLRGAGIPNGGVGALHYPRDEQACVVAVLFASMAFGGCAGDDLFFVPDHGRQIVRTDHHDVVHVDCGGESRMEVMVAHMARRGYFLPQEPPDWTFKWPYWMPRQGDEQADDVP